MADTAANEPSPAAAGPSSLARAVTLAAVPLFVLSQWLGLRWHLPARLPFNALLLGATLAVLVTGRRRLARHRTEVALAGVLLGVLALSTLRNGVPWRVAVTGWVPYLAVPLAAVAGLAAGADDDTVHAGALVAGLTGVVVATAAALQLLLGRAAYVALGQDLPYPRWWERGRATGLLVNPGRLGQLGTVWIGLAAAADTWAPWLAVAGGAAVGFSGSRIALLATAALAAVWLATRRNAASRILLAGTGAAVAAFALVVLLVPAARADLLGRSAALGDARLDVRTANLQATSALLADRPWLGAGPGRFGSPTAWRTHSDLHDRYRLPDVRSPEFVAALRAAGDTREIDVGIAQLDLGWLQVAAETGLVGLAAFAALLGALLVRAVAAGSPAAAALVVAVAVLGVAAPTIVDFSFAAVVLWWVGILIGAPPVRHGAT